MKYRDIGEENDSISESDLYESYKEPYGGTYSNMTDIYANTEGVIPEQIYQYAEENTYINNLHKTLELEILKEELENLKRKKLEENIINNNNGTYTIGSGGGIKLSNADVGKSITLNGISGQITEVKKDGSFVIRGDANIYANVYTNPNIHRQANDFINNVTSKNITDPNVLSDAYSSIFRVYAPASYDNFAKISYLKGIGARLYGEETSKQVGEEITNLSKLLIEGKGKLTEEQSAEIAKRIYELKQFDEGIKTGLYATLFASEAKDAILQTEKVADIQNIAIKGLDKSLEERGYAIDAKKYREVKQKKEEVLNELAFDDATARFIQNEGIDESETENVKAKIKELTKIAISDKELFKQKISEGDNENFLPYIEAMLNAQNVNEYLASDLAKQEKGVLIRIGDTRWKTDLISVQDPYSEQTVLIKPEIGEYKHGKFKYYDPFMEYTDPNKLKYFSSIAIERFADKNEGIGENIGKGIIHSLIKTAEVAGMLTQINPYTPFGGSKAITLPILNYLDRLSPNVSEKADANLINFSDKYMPTYNINSNNVAFIASQFVVDLATSMGAGALVKTGLKASAKTFAKYSAKQGVVGTFSNTMAKGLMKAAVYEKRFLPNVLGKYGGRLSVPTVIGGGIIDATEKWKEAANEDMNAVSRAFTFWSTLAVVGTLENLIDVDLHGSIIMGKRMPTNVLKKAVSEGGEETANKSFSLKSAWSSVKNKITNTITPTEVPTRGKTYLENFVEQTTSVNVEQSIQRKVLGIKKENLFTETIEKEGTTDTIFWRKDSNPENLTTTEVNPPSIIKDRIATEGKFVKDGYLYEEVEGKIIKTKLTQVNENGLTINEIANISTQEAKKAKWKVLANKFLTSLPMNSAYEGLTEGMQDLSVVGISHISNAIHALTSFRPAPPTEQQIQEAKQKVATGNYTQKEIDILTAGKQRLDTEYSLESFANAFAIGAIASMGVNVVGKVGKSSEKKFEEAQEKYKKALAEYHGLDLSKEEDAEKFDSIYANSFNLVRLTEMGLDHDYFLELEKLVKKGYVSKEVYNEQRRFVRSYKVSNELYGDKFNKAWNKLNYAVNNESASDVAKFMFINSLKHKDVLMAKRNKLNNILNNFTVSNTYVPDTAISISAQIDKADKSFNASDALKYYELEKEKLEENRKKILKDFNDELSLVAKQEILNSSIRLEKIKSDAKRAISAFVDKTSKKDSAGKDAEKKVYENLIDKVGEAVKYHDEKKRKLMLMEKAGASDEALALYEQLNYVFYKLGGLDANKSLPLSERKAEIVTLLDNLQKETNAIIDEGINNRGYKRESIDALKAILPFIGGIKQRIEGAKTKKDLNNEISATKTLMSYLSPILFAEVNNRSSAINNFIHARKIGAVQNSPTQTQRQKTKSEDNISLFTVLETLSFIYDNSNNKKVKEKIDEFINLIKELEQSFFFNEKKKEEANKIIADTTNAYTQEEKEIAKLYLAMTSAYERFKYNVDSDSLITLSASIEEFLGYPKTEAYIKANRKAISQIKVLNNNLLFIFKPKVVNDINPDLIPTSFMRIAVEDKNGKKVRKIKKTRGEFGHTLYPDISLATIDSIIDMFAINFDNLYLGTRDKVFDKQEKIADYLSNLANSTAVQGETNDTRNFLTRTASNSLSAFVVAKQHIREFLDKTYGLPKWTGDSFLNEIVNNFTLAVYNKGLGDKLTSINNGLYIDPRDEMIPRYSFVENPEYINLFLPEIIKDYGLDSLMDIVQSLETSRNTYEDTINKIANYKETAPNDLVEEANARIKNLTNIRDTIDKEIKEIGQIEEAKNYSDFVKYVDKAIEASKIEELERYKDVYFSYKKDKELFEAMKPHIVTGMQHFARFYSLIKSMPNFNQFVSEDIQENYVSSSYSPTRANEIFSVALSQYFSSLPINDILVPVFYERMNEILEGDENAKKRLLRFISVYNRTLQPKDDVSEITIDEFLSAIKVFHEKIYTSPSYFLLENGIPEPTIDSNFIAIYKRFLPLAMELEFFKNNSDMISVLIGTSITNKEIINRLKNSIDAIGGYDNATKESIKASLTSFFGSLDKATNPNYQPESAIVRAIKSLVEQNKEEINKNVDNALYLEDLMLFNPDKVPMGMVSVLQSIVGKSKGGLYKDADLENLSLGELINLLKFLKNAKRAQSLTDNAGIMLKNNKTSIEQLDDLIKEVENLLENVKNIQLNKHNKSVLDVRNHVEEIIKRLSDIPSAKKSAIDKLSTLFSGEYYTIKNIQGTSAVYYELNPDILQEVYDTFKDIYTDNPYYREFVDTISNLVKTEADAGFAYSLQQQLNGLLAGICLYTDRPISVVGGGGTGKTTSIRLAVNAYAKVYANNNTDANGNKEKINVHVIVPNQHLQSNPSYNNFVEEIDATSYVYEKNDDSAINAIKNIKDKEKNIVIIDEAPLFDDRFFKEIDTVISDNANVVPFSVIMAYDVGQVLNTKNILIDNQISLPSFNIVWRNANYGLSKAIQAILPQTTHNKIDDTWISSVSYPSENVLLNNLANNLYSTDKEGVEVLTEATSVEGFVSTAKSISESDTEGLTMKILVSTEEEKNRIAEELNKQDVKNIELQTISEAQGSETDIVFVYTEELSHKTRGDFGSYLYTATTRAKQKVYYSPHMFGSIAYKNQTYIPNELSGQGMAFASDKNLEFINNANLSIKGNFSYKIMPTIKNTVSTPSASSTATTTTPPPSPTTTPTASSAKASNTTTQQNGITIQPQIKTSGATQQTQPQTQPQPQTQAQTQQPKQETLSDIKTVIKNNANARKDKLGKLNKNNFFIDWNNVC